MTFLLPSQPEILSQILHPSVQSKALLSTTSEDEEAAAGAIPPTMSRASFTCSSTSADATDDVSM